MYSATVGSDARLNNTVYTDEDLSDYYRSSINSLGSSLNLAREYESFYNIRHPSSLDQGTLDILMQREHVAFQERMRAEALQEEARLRSQAWTGGREGTEIYETGDRIGAITSFGSNDSNAENNNRLMGSDGSQGSLVDGKASESPGNRDADDEGWDDMEENEEEDR